MQILNENLIYLQKGTKSAAQPDNNTLNCEKRQTNQTSLWLWKNQEAKPDQTNLKTHESHGMDEGKVNCQ